MEGASLSVYFFVTVDTPVTRRTPHRSRRAELPHRAPASGSNAKALFLAASRILSSSLHRASLALCPDPVSQGGIPLGQPPSLHLLRRPLVVTNFVRRLLRYYGVVRLPATVHHGRTLVGSPCGPYLWYGRSQGLPIPAQKVSTHAAGLRLRRSQQCPAFCYCRYCVPLRPTRSAFELD